MSWQWEKPFLRFLVTLLIFVGVIQGLLQFEGMRRILNRSIWLEGEPIARSIAGLDEPVYPFLEWTAASAPDDVAVGGVSLRIIEPSSTEVWVLVNGIPLKKLTPEDSSVTLRDGDRLEVFALDSQLSVTVSAVTDNVAFPPIGFLAEGRGRVLIGEAQIE